MSFDWATFGLGVIAASSLSFHNTHRAFCWLIWWQYAVFSKASSKGLRSFPLLLLKYSNFSLHLISNVQKKFPFVITFNFLTVSTITSQRKALNSWSQCSDIKKIYIRLSNFRNFHKLMPQNFWKYVFRLHFVLDGPKARDSASMNWKNLYVIKT